MRIVALVPGGISEQILFFPTLDDLKRYYPKAQIDVVVEPRSKAAYRVSRSVKDVLTFDFKDRNSLADWANLVGVMREREYDIAIVVGQIWLVGLVLWLTGIPKRIGYKDQGIALLTNPIGLKTDQYTGAAYHDLLQGLGINSPSPELAINVPKLDIDWANKEQQRLGIKSGYILIHSGLSELALNGSNTTYSVENWLLIIQDLINKQPDLPIVVISSPGEDSGVLTIAQSTPTVKKVEIEPNDVGKLAAMIAGANLMLCTDHASMHLSVAVETYTIALFGSTDPAKLLPKSEKFIAIKSPTGNIKDISPKAVLEKIWRG